MDCLDLEALQRVLTTEHWDLCFICIKSPVVLPPRALYVYADLTG